MHPAYSVIFFTTASGAGYGLLFLIGLGNLAGLLPTDRVFGLTTLGVALGLITFGLLASTLHLGHKERSWRALSQWRSSWLSREGVAAIFTYVPAFLFGYGWIILEEPAGWALWGALAAIAAAITVYCTAMIYASLRAIPRWHNKFTPPVYLVMSLATGAVCLAMLLHLSGHGAGPSTWLLIVVLAAAGAVKALYWKSIDEAAPVATVESATGLGGLGAVKLLDSPHTSENYLQREMGYRVARKHAVKLRLITSITLFYLPIILQLIIATVDIASVWLAILTFLSVTLGVVIERWLFFAEAKHVVMLYYGEQAV